ncbi:phospholipase A1-like [Anopheles nili]|uniref:phospholipase A1-like n=1 Tax=Anopheles nili TaxID=185578 RepID=UPI00237C5031|nr:phospholipase A1-like [Anopheles nili]
MARNRVSLLSIVVLLWVGTCWGCAAVSEPTLVGLLEHDLEDMIEWVRIPTAAGEWIWTHRKAIGSVLMQRLSHLQPSDIEFLLYTRQDIDNTGHRLELDNVVESLAGSNFRSARPTRIVVHGWLNSKNSPIAENIRDAYLLQWDFNVIVVDWSACAMHWNYVQAVGCVPTVGQSLAQLLDELQRHTGLVLENVYIVGHSLGAHVAGIAGKTVQTGEIHTIVALDPALPLFSLHKPANRIGPSDAKYVEVIHTNGGSLGLLQPIGTADFYPNGGSRQPGCGLDVIGLCSHTRAWELFVETLLEEPEKLLANQIDSLDQLYRPTLLSRQSAIEQAKMGGEPSSAGQARGIYSISTREKSPFFC